jgi:hypothetical protein
MEQDQQSVTAPRSETAISPANRTTKLVSRDKGAWPAGNTVPNGSRRKVGQRLRPNVFEVSKEVAKTGGNTKIPMKLIIYGG